MELKSVISSHTASLSEVISRAGDVAKCGTLISSIYISCSCIDTYKLGENIYILTYINDTLVAFELKGVYCFRILL